MRRKRIISALMAVGLVITLSAPVFADPLSDMLKEKEAQEQRLKEQNTLLQTAENKVEELEIAIQKLDSQIEKLMRQVDDNKKELIKSEAAIEVAKKDVEKAKNDIDDQQQLFDKRMRAIYMSGSQGYLSIILKSQGISDLVSKIEAVNKIIQFDKKLVKELEEKKEVLEKKKEVLDVENKRLLTIKADNEQKLAKLSQSKNEQSALIKEARKQRTLAASKASETKAAIAAAEKKIKELRDAAPKINPSRGNATASQANVIAFASNYLGHPYLWGGNGEPLTKAHIDKYRGTNHDLSGMERYIGMAAFDCSGYVRHVYAHFGIYLTRTTYTQIREGVGVSRENLQPGDLVFFGDWSDPYHVGIYVGENCYIHAPQSGDVIRISPLTRRDYLTARRILR